MARRIFQALYPNAIAALLIVAGGLKVHELATTRNDERVFYSIAAGFEILFGIILFSRMANVATRIIALALFIAYLNFSVSKAIDGAATCGCFGRIKVHPWNMAFMNLLAIFVVAFAGRKTTASSISEIRARRPVYLMTLLVSVVVTLCVGIFVVSEMSKKARRTISDADQQIVNHIRDSIAQQQARLHTISGSMDRVYRDLTINETKKYVKYKPDGRIDYVAIAEPLVRKNIRFWIKGRQIRKDTIESGATALIDVISDGRHLDYHPKIEQAWIRDEYACDIGDEPIDPRCLGFNTPLWYLPDWFNRVEVSNVDKIVDGENTAYRLKVRDAIKFSYEVVFSSAHGYLPTKAVIVDAGENVITNVNWSYEHIISADAWFPNRVRIEQRMVRDGKPDPKPGTLLEFSSTGPLLANQEVPIGIFDPQLSPRCHVTGLITHSSPVGLTSPLAMSTVVGFFEAKLTQPSKLLPLLGLNGGLLATLWVLRHRLML